MKMDIKKYFKSLQGAFSRIEASGKDGKSHRLDKAIDFAIDMINKTGKGKNKLIFIGNGGSASIASHMATDFLKNAGIPAIAFNDSSLLTCLSNDLGYDSVFKKPIEMLADRGDLLIAISSSGKSVNIIKAVNSARKRGLKIITLSGFAVDNPLRESGDMNFYVPLAKYGPVEILHQLLCHYMLDVFIEEKNG